MSSTDDPTAEIADLYAFLSGVIADPPDEQAVAHLANEQFPREASPQSLANGYRLLRKWQASVDDPAEEADRLAKVHTRLFVGPRPRMQLHESWYADDFMGQPLAVVQSSYRDLGIRPTEELREEPDHLAVELAALELLTRDGDEALRQAFYQLHGWWLPMAAGDIKEMVDDRFYEGIGWLLEGAIEADAYLLSVDLDRLTPAYLDSPSS